MQRKILLTTIICSVVTGTAEAQIKKGAILLGGGLGFSAQASASAGSANTKQTNITVMPAFSKAVKDNLAVGADLTYGYFKSDNSVYHKVEHLWFGCFCKAVQRIGQRILSFWTG